MILPPVYDVAASSAQEAIWLEALSECLSPFDDEALLNHLEEHPDPSRSENARRLRDYLDARHAARQAAIAGGADFGDLARLPSGSQVIDAAMRGKAVGRVQSKRKARS